MNGRTNTTSVTEVVEGVQVALEAPTNLVLTPLNARVDLTWTDPVDKYAAPDGQTATNPWDNVATWDHSIVVRKAGSAPTSPSDGELVYTETTRNQHQYTAYSDTANVINNTVYYYAVYAVTSGNVISEPVVDHCKPIEGTPKFSKAVKIDDTMFRPTATAAVDGYAIYVCEGFLGAYDANLTKASMSYGPIYFTTNTSSRIGELSSNKYAMFAGGIERGLGSNPLMDEYTETVAYDHSLTAYTSAQLKNGYGPAVAKAFKGYLIFAGGSWYSYTSAYGSSSVNYTDAFDESFTNISTMPLLETYPEGGNGVSSSASATTPNYLLIAGGYSHATTSASSSTSTYVDNVEVFDESLTKVRAGEIKLSCAKTPSVGLSINNRAVFFGGSGESINKLAVEVFDDSLTRSTAVSLPFRVNARGDVFGSYAMLLAGSYNNGMVMYDSSLTQISTLDNKIDEYDGSYPTRETAYQMSDSVGFISAYNNGGDNWDCHMEVFDIV